MGEASMMSADEAGLVRAILADPHDGLARAAYADWLEEQALPLHAELMRLPLPPRGRLPVEALRTGIIAALSGGSGVHPNRGDDGLLLVLVQMRVFRMKELQRLGPAALREQHVIRLLLDGQTKDWAAVADSPLIAAVPGLGLRGCDLRKGGAKSLSASPALPSLWSLALGARASAKDVETFCAAPLDGLIHLDLSRSPVNAGAIRALSSGPAAGRLRHLELGICKLAGKAVAALAGSPALLSGLVTLDLAGNDLEDGSLDFLFDATLANLRSLDLGTNPLTDATLLSLAGSGLAGRLRWLNLSWALLGFSHAGLRRLAESLSPECRVRFVDHPHNGPRGELAAIFGERLLWE
jgi:uncharacterized protein (TIGR02996 family)